MKSWLLAWQFLTRLPVTIAGELDEGQMTNSVIFYPAVGAVLGGGLHLLRWLGLRFWPPLTVGLLLVAAQVLLTGGLHLDGLADVTDGWYGSGDRERRLTIMKDSRIGTLGALALLLVVPLKASLLATTLPQLWQTLIIYEAGAKLMLVAAIVAFPYARASGTGASFRQVRLRQLLVAAVLPLALLVVAPWQLAVAAALAAVLNWLLAQHWSRQLGGLTGDCYGALHELWQVSFLLLLEVIR